MKRQRIRVYCPYFPYPVTEGAYQIMFDQVRVLSLYHDVELVTWKESASQVAAKLRGLDPFHGRVTVRSWGSEGVGRESLGTRIWRTFRSILSPSPSPADFYFPRFKDRRGELPDVDLGIYHYTYAWNWLSSRLIGREKKKVLHFHNVESDLYRLRAEREKVRLLRPIHGLNSRKLERIERTLPKLVDECWYVSKKDAFEFRNRFAHPPEIQRVRPPSYASAQLEERQRRFQQWQAEHGDVGPVIGFVGTLDFDPNVMSLEWILDRVCPELLRQRWCGTLRIVGRNPSPGIRAKMASFPFVDYLGYIEDMENFWGGLSAFLIPHIEGSGVRVKLLDALASGIPTLANSAAVERIDDRLGVSPLLWVSDDPAAWIQRILGLDRHIERQSYRRRPLEPALDGDFVYGDFRE